MLKVLAVTTCLSSSASLCLVVLVNLDSMLSRLEELADELVDTGLDRALLRCGLPLQLAARGNRALAL